MATYAVTDTQLSAIADAIRLKTDNPAQMSVDDMPMQIGLIESGGGSRETWTSPVNLTTPADIAAYIDAYVDTTNAYAFFIKSPAIKETRYQCVMFSIKRNTGSVFSIGRTYSDNIPLNLPAITTTTANSCIINVGDVFEIVKLSEL